MQTAVEDCAILLWYVVELQQWRLIRVEAIQRQALSRAIFQRE